MSEVTAFAAGKVVWAGEAKQARNGQPMRSVMLSVGKDGVGVAVLVFGNEAEAIAVGDGLAAEGPVEAKLRTKDGETKAALSIMARWAKLTGQAGQKVQPKRPAPTKPKQSKQHDLALAAQAPSGDCAPFYNDPIPF